MFDPFVLLACAVGALFVGFIITALILEYVCHQLRSTRRRIHQLGAETKRYRDMEKKRDVLRKQPPLSLHIPRSSADREIIND